MSHLYLTKPKVKLLSYVLASYVLDGAYNGYF
jgi:hypothetical protein